MKRWQSFNTYFQIVPRIVTVQWVATVALMVCAYLMHWAARWALASQGRVAVTTGDFAFLFTSWQGWLLIALALCILYLSIAFDINAPMAFAGRWLRGEDDSIILSVRDGLMATRHLLSPAGLLVVLYVSLLAPIVRVGLSISMTEKLYIPSFILSVIDTTPLYHAFYNAFMLVFSIVGFLGTFVLHGMVLDNMSAFESMRQSFTLIRTHWVDYLRQTLVFFLKLVLFMVAAGVLIASIQLLVLGALYNSGYQSARFVMLVATILSGVCFFFAMGVVTMLTLVKMTERYLSYTNGLPSEPVTHKRRHHPFVVLLVVLTIAGSGLFAYLMEESFDELFPLTSDVKVIAHRACGNEGVENTAAGIDAAVRSGSWGAEIDIQRTADGYYIVNHDNTFKRVAGVDRKPSEMTLAEIKQLTVANTVDPSAPGEPVSTYEELLEASRDRVVLFVELKGQTADRQMADDAYRIAKDLDMLDQCVFISLKYNLIDYMEDTYPDAKTGFLAFASFGNTADLNTDYLALEEEAMRGDSIAAIHEQGKGALVWTINSEEAQRHFLLSEADAIITDNMTQAQEIRDSLALREDLDRVFDTLSSKS